ncbi:MAG: hypothetical protein HYY02_02970 [Chloroflexi bacterium]|nr:hypothetical protein [Chloroflexota bacterium]
MAAGMLMLDAALYLLSGWVVSGGLGFPLDDSWIHQTLARSLAASGQLAVNPGEPVAASTSLLWTLLLAVGYLLGLAPLLWAYLLGLASLVLLAWETLRLGRALLPQASPTPWLAGLLVLLEWHLVWAAFSGMETLLFAALTVGALREYAQRGLDRPWWLGVWLGLATLTRPEGLALGLLVAGWELVVKRGRRWASLAPVGLALGAVLLPGALANLALSGGPLPATFLAKHAAYGVERDLLSWAGYLGGALLTLARGPLLLAYPGVAYGLARRFPGLAPAWPLPLLWGVVLLLLYMVWLPALYHHGRYLFAVIPLVGLYGLEGARLLLERLPFRLLPRATLVIAGALLLVSWVRGAQVYGQNVRTIAQQQVQAALWLQSHTPSNAVVATHDIGAVSYFSGRRLVDIAGLASPELVTAPRDVKRILVVLEAKEVTHVALLPGWLPQLYERLRNTPGAEVAWRAPPEDETNGGIGTFEVLRFMRN